MWLHASPNFIADTECVLPPTVRGCPPQWAAEETVNFAEQLRQYRRDRVYVFESSGAPIEDHVGRFRFVTPESYVYEVEPIGALEADPDRAALDTFRCCPRARVVRCLRKPR